MSDLLPSSTERVVKVLRKLGDALYSPRVEGEWRVEYKPGVASYGPRGSLLYAYPCTARGKWGAVIFVAFHQQFFDELYEVWECEAEVVKLTPRFAVGTDYRVFSPFWEIFGEAIKGGKDPISRLDVESWVARAEHSVWCRWIRPIRLLTINKLLMDAWEGRSREDRTEIPHDPTDRSFVI
jgi:hypothetical protein